MHSLVKRKLDNAWQGRDSLVMLVDVGAGTTDITLVKYTVTGSEVQVVATRGNNVMGGLNVTQHLYDTVLDGMDDAQKAAAKSHHKRLFLVRWG
jgi:molecular chaperone DnaK (HSP70)